MRRRGGVGVEQTSGRAGSRRPGNTHCHCFFVLERQRVPVAGKFALPQFAGLFTSGRSYLSLRREGEWRVGVVSSDDCSWMLLGRCETSCELDGGRSGMEGATSTPPEPQVGSLPR